MSPRISATTSRAFAAVAAVLAVASGCTVGQDDEMARPTRTITASPSPRAVAVPATIPVGHGAVSPTDPVWAQESLLHVGRGRVDLTPRRVDAFVVVRGGVYFLDRGEVWFTDLVRVRDTGLRDVTRLATNKDASALRVEVTPTSGAAPTMHAYDARDGSAVPPESIVPATVTDRLGRSVLVSLRPERSDVSPPPPVEARRGPGRFGVLVGDAQPLVAFDAGTRVRVPLSGVVGNGFELVRWTSGTTFHGLARSGTRPLGVMRCDLATRSCVTLGKVLAGDSLVFESGT